MKMNLVMQNPPYKIGNEITASVIKNVQFDQFVDLEPMSDFKKQDLWRYIKDVEIVKDNKAFGDADVLPVIACLSKKHNDYKTQFELLLKQNYFGILTKYIEENLKRQPYDVIIGGQGLSVMDCVIDNEHNFFMPTFSYKVYRSGNTYEANVNKNNSKLIDFVKKNDKLEKGHGSTMYTITKLQIYERDNLSNLFYNCRLIDMLLWFDLVCPLQPYELIPRVDLTRSWTDEEILKDYGYTEEEIKEILK